MTTSVITGDIIRSNKFKNPKVWLDPLKKALIKTETDQKYWEIFRGDSFQIEVRDNQKAFLTAIYIKACIKSVKGLDVRMAIGIGHKTFEGDTVTESNGEAFQFSGETLENLKKEKTNLKIKSRDTHTNEELNLYFKLALIAMDNWTVSSSEAIKVSIENFGALQSEIAELLGINQEAVSKRLKRAYFNEILSLDRMYHKKITLLEQNIQERK
ncbi:transcriptional regulator [Hyunsoonleella flava]|uniref:Transcriptional regulator n=1 Tax=Hyunsoonleella flava TaxID=2527939 RepID=A0A4V2JA91_9FLAO|nr:SatD family protein [Hyunsoonleella flava]TBN04764.1 transcriptional regulator [Hyunsoonleella flava]